MRTFVPAFATAAFAASLFAQTPLVAPPGYATLEGNSNNAFPWNRGTGTAHVQFVYDSTNFTTQAVVGPIVITRLRYRADGVAATWTGGTYSHVQIDMSTCPVDFMSVSSVFAGNHGSDLTTVLNGPVTIQPGTSTAAGPGPWHIDIPLTTPFLYDPTSGNDLTVDIMLDGATFGGGTLTQADHHTGGALGSRIYDVTTGVPNSTAGTVGTDYVAVCEFTYQVGSGFASTRTFGEGCYHGAVSWYESFPVSTFDLGVASGVNTVEMLPTGNGYLVLPGPTTWYTPTSANLGLGDDAISGSQSLPFTFNYPGGSTNAIVIESNGNVWLQPPTHTAFTCSTSVGSLLSRGPVISAFYDDLDPTATGGGSINFDVDPNGQVVYCTWTAVPIWTATPASPRPTNTFQVAIYSSGLVDLRYQQMDSTGSWTTTLTGFSPGMNNTDPGQIDISAAMPFITRADSRPLALRGVGRPIMGGTSFALEIRDIPATSPLGFVNLGFTQYAAGVPLASIGMPDCFLYASPDARLVTAFTTSPTSVGLPIPNLAALAGLHVYAQAGAFDATANALGILASNGLAMTLNLQ